MLDDDCIYCQEIPTTDPNMPERRCMYYAATDKKDVDICVGIMRCRYYAPKNKVGATPYKHEDLKDYYDPDSKPSHYDWDLNCNLENTVRNENGGLCSGIIEACEGREPRTTETEENYDVISKPSHYTEGRKYEPKDVIRDWELNFNLGNTVKYVARAGRKDDILQDLKKARQYLDFEIEYLEKEREEK